MKNKTFIAILLAAFALICTGAAYGQSSTIKSDTVKCAGINTKGLPCKSTWVEHNGFCRVHNPDKITCGAPKANGEPCRQVVSHEGETCSYHSAKPRLMAARSSRSARMVY